ncbi:MAG: hypothetical protein CK431_10285 [Mycobacterium sp.]|nr:MAG: hypothetical protein CK431_10285 [Mycobacterium sp.]
MNQPPSVSDLSLQDLIRTLKGDRTYAGLEEASGGVVKAQRWNQIVNGIRISEFPEPRTINAMARALNVNVEVIVLAFARAVGLDVQRHRSVFADLLPPMVNNLTDKQRDALLGIVRSMNDTTAAEGGDQDAPPAPAVTKPRSAKSPRNSAKRLRPGVPPI